MAKKRARFDWSADPEDPALRVPVDRAPRAPLKARLRELQALALELVAVPASERRQLPLAPEIIDAIDELARLPPSPARKRQMNYLKRLMGDVDVEAVRAAVGGDTPRADRLREADRWRTRLVDGGDEALGAFLSAYPTADRPRLRALIRKSGDRPSRALFDAIVETLESAAD